MAMPCGELARPSETSLALDRSVSYALHLKKSGRLAGTPMMRDEGEVVADVISAEEGALKRGAQAVNTAKAGVDQQVKKVRSEIEQVSGFWTGAAAGAYTQLMARWNQETTKLNEVLVTLEEALSGTERDQAASEESHQQTISGLNSMMGA